jgi:uncharacterized protein YdaU (DUF1376 family)
MTNRTLPMMPFFPQDFLTATQLWKFPARGAYALLLMYEWILDELPNNTEELARLVGMEFHEFEDVWLTVSKKFEESEDGTLFNQRLKEHREGALARKEAKRAGAAITNQKRWGNRPVDYRKPLAKRLAQRNAQRVDIESPPSPSPSPSEIQESLLGDESPNTRTPRRKRQRAPELDPIQFSTFQEVYPERAGDYRWGQARHGISARLEEGHTWEEIIEGAKRYREWAMTTGKFATEYVMQASRFVGPDKSFQLPWRATTPPPSSGPKKAATFDEWHAAQKLRAEKD